MGRSLLVVMRRGSLRAAEEITGHKYETIGRWLRLAAEHAEALTEVLVHDLELSVLEVDELWSFVRRRSAASRPRARRSGAAALGLRDVRTARAASSSLTPVGAIARRPWRPRRSERPMPVRRVSRFPGAATAGERTRRRSGVPTADR